MFGLLRIRGGPDFRGTDLARHRHRPINRVFASHHEVDKAGLGIDIGRDGDCWSCRVEGDVEGLAPGCVAVAVLGRASDYLSTRVGRFRHRQGDRYVWPEIAAGHALRGPVDLAGDISDTGSSFAEFVGVHHAGDREGDRCTLVVDGVVRARAGWAEDQVARKRERWGLGVAAVSGARRQGPEREHSHEAAHKGQRGMRAYATGAHPGPLVDRAGGP